MTGSLRSAVPGQLCLLELLQQVGNPNRPDRANVPSGSDGTDEPAYQAVGAASEVEPVQVELGEWERAVLRFAAEHHLTGRYDERVRQQLGCSATRYLQALSGMLDRPEVLAAAPELISRLRLLRDRRQHLRQLGRGRT